MPPICFADVAGTDPCLRIGAFAPNNAVYTMQYMKARPICSTYFFGSRSAGPRGHPLVAGVLPSPDNPTGDKIAGATAVE